MDDNFRATLMRTLIYIGILSGGLALGWLLPNEFVPQSWRIPLAAFLIGAGIALAVAAFW